jgi:hypothetical protein
VNAHRCPLCQSPRTLQSVTTFEYQPRRPRSATEAVLDRREETQVTDSFCCLTCGYSWDEHRPAPY